MGMTDLADPMDEMDVLDVIAGLDLASEPAMADLFPDDVHLDHRSPHPSHTTKNPVPCPLIIL